MKKYLLLFLIISGLIDEALGLYIYRKVGLLDISIILFSIYFYLKKITYFHNHNKRSLIIFLGLVVIAGLVNYGISFSGGYIHYIRVIIMSYLSFYIGGNLVNDPEFKKHLNVFKLTPLLLFAFMSIKFRQMGVNVSGAFDVNKPDINVGLFNWNMLSAVASLSLFFIYLPKNNNDKIYNILLVIMALYIIIISVSRTAFTSLLIFTIAYLFLNKIRYKQVFFSFIFLFLIISVFYSRIEDFYTNQYSWFFNYKLNTYENNLLDTRIGVIIVTQLREFFHNNKYFLFGQGDVLGHSFLITIAIKSGIFSLVAGIVYYIKYYMFSRSIIDKKYRIIYRILFIVIVLQMTVADYSFTSSYYTFIAFVLLGIFKGISQNYKKTYEDINC